MRKLVPVLLVCLLIIVALITSANARGPTDLDISEATTPNDQASSLDTNQANVDEMFYATLDTSSEKFSTIANAPELAPTMCLANPFGSLTNGGSSTTTNYPSTAEQAMYLSNDRVRQDIIMSGREGCTTPIGVNDTNGLWPAPMTSVHNDITTDDC